MHTLVGGSLIGKDSLTIQLIIRKSYGLASLPRKEIGGNDGSASSANQLDFLSNGFKIRGESYEVNSNGVDQMIFAAWAEMPLKYARGG